MGNLKEDTERGADEDPLEDEEDEDWDFAEEPLGGAEAISPRRNLSISRNTYSEEGNQLLA